MSFCFSCSACGGLARGLLLPQAALYITVSILFRTVLYEPKLNYTMPQYTFYNYYGTLRYVGFPSQRFLTGGRGVGTAFGLWLSKSLT